MKLSCPKCPFPAVLSEWSCPRCHATDVLSQLAQLFHPGCPILAGCPVQDIFSQLLWLYHPGYLVLVVLSLLPYSGHSCHSASVSYPGCTIPSVFLTFLSQFSVPAFLSWLSCPGCLVLAVLSKLPYTSCPACLSCPRHPIQTVLPLLSSPSCPVLAAQPRHPLSTALLMSLSCPGSPILCPVQAHSSRLTSQADM